jgi:hypothetical protein
MSESAAGRDSAAHDATEDWQLAHGASNLVTLCGAHHHALHRGAAGP